MALLVIATAQLKVVLAATIVDVALPHIQRAPGHQTLARSAIAELRRKADAHLHPNRPGQHGDQGKASSGGVDRRLAVGLVAAAATFGVACYLHLDGRMFFRADTIPLSDLEHPDSCLAGHQAIHKEPPMTPAVRVTGLLAR